VDTVNALRRQSSQGITVGRFPKLDTEDYDRIGRARFPKCYFHPADMVFARSDALFPPAELSASIGAEYERQCRLLRYGPHPSWAEVQARFAELRCLL
jgi:hypothetical protein